MSVAGLKKQFYKASQLVSEKVGGAEGTKLDDDFKDLERRADVTSKAVVELMNKTTEYLQPNPATRAKLSMLNTVSKIRGQVNSPGYAQPEGLLGESMTKYGKEMGDSNTNFGGALVEVGESMKRLAEIKDSLDIDVKQNFIDPLQAFADKDIKDIQHHMKKLESRRLDYDYKKKRQGKIPDDEVKLALEKFHESIELASGSMHHMLESDVEHVTQLSCLVDHLLQYHRESSTILEDLSGRLQTRITEANARPRQQYVPKSRPSFDYGDSNHSNGGYSSNASSPPAYSSGPQGQLTGPSFQRASTKNRQQPSCQALYDFEPENEGELGFKEGDVITLISQIDENWMEGTLRGQTGFFPISFVNITVPLPN